MLGQAWRVLTPACVMLALSGTNVGAGLEGTHFSLCGVGSKITNVIGPSVDEALWKQHQQLLFLNLKCGFYQIVSTRQTLSKVNITVLNS